MIIMVKNMNDILNDITNYIDYLRECGFLIMLSCFNPALDNCLPTLINYEAHLPDICLYLKSKPDTREKCIRNKQKLNDRSPKQTYYSCCWAGVEEYVIPIVYQNDLVCCINLSGYRNSLHKSKLLSEKLMNKFGKDFSDNYFRLHTEIPDIENIQKFTNPLKYMFFALYEQCMEFCGKNCTTYTIYLSAIRYINDHYMEKLNIDKIAYAVNCSPSYLRYIFKQNKQTIMGYVNSIRLNRAATFLRFTSNPITNIAFDCGFNDSNYFSSAFKKCFGIPPTKYRKEFSVLISPK